MRTVAALVRTWALVELVCMRPKGGWCGGADANGENKMSPSLPETSNLPSVFMFARVYSLGHSANKFFAECCAKSTQQKKYSVKRRFAECKKTLGKDMVCRVSKKNTRQSNKIIFLKEEEEEKWEFFLPSAQI